MIRRNSYSVLATLVVLLGLFVWTRLACGMMMGHKGGMMGERPEAPQLPQLAAENLPDPHSEGARLLVRFCTQCHNLPGPRLHTADEWPSVVRRMAGYMQQESGGGMMMMHRVEEASDRELAVIDSYLSDHARNKPTRHPAPPAGNEGERAFVAFCSRCHALPDPTSHTPEGWPGVVQRMQGYMKAEGKKSPSPAELKAIIGYLQGKNPTSEPPPADSNRPKGPAPQ